jgi:glycosyltransferase involved in cell wall biosynthesis
MGAGKVILAAANENTYGAGVLRNGWNFILVKPGDPDLLAKTIIDLLNNPKKCQTIGDRARQTIYEHFSWDRVCSQTLEVYRETIWRCT